MIQSFSKTHSDPQSWTVSQALDKSKRADSWLYDSWFLSVCARVKDRGSYVRNGTLGYGLLYTAVYTEYCNPFKTVYNNGLWNAKCFSSMPHCTSSRCMLNLASYYLMLFKKKSYFVYNFIFVIKSWGYWYYFALWDTVFSNVKYSCAAWYFCGNPDTFSRIFWWIGSEMNSISNRNLL